MAKDRNTLEVEWLQQKPERLLEHYQYIIEAVAARFISRGFFAPEDKMELVQEVNVMLLENKLAKMQEQYNGTVFLRTYFSRIVYNCCRELVRRQQRQPDLLSAELLYDKASPGRSAYEELAIRDEMKRLQALLRGHRQYLKLLLCLKLWVRTPFREEEWQFLENDKTRPVLASLRKATEPGGATDKEAFGLAAALFNEIEGKSTDGDSLRRWLHQQVDRAIVRMNGQPPVSSYSRESFKLLLRFYFEAEWS